MSIKCNYCLRGQFEQHFPQQVAAIVLFYGSESKLEFFVTRFSL